MPRTSKRSPSAADWNCISHRNSRPRAAAGIGSFKSGGFFGSVVVGTDDSGERAKPKAWKEIWGSGQGVGSVGKVVPTAELIARFRREYDEAVDPAL